MQLFRSVVGLLLALPALASSSDDTKAKPAPAEIKLEVIKHQALLNAIKARAGRIVVIDFWADFCIPCKEEFPHLVELHERYHSAGVDCISVSVDDVKDRAKALKFLKKQRAVFANYLLDEPAQLWQEHWDLFGPPAVFVYNRGGKLVGRFNYNNPDKQFTYDDVRALVAKLMKEPVRKRRLSRT